MAKTIRDLMTPNPTSLSKTASVLDAARAMRDANIGNIIVLDQDKVCGIDTDRDVVVRAVAEGRDIASTRLQDICSQELTTISPDKAVDEAVRLMRDKAIRRLPVVEHGKPVGVVSIGDLALEKDPDSALGEISGAPANR